MLAVATTPTYLIPTSLTSGTPPALAGQKKPTPNAIEQPQAQIPFQIHDLS